MKHLPLFLCLTLPLMAALPSLAHAQEETEMAEMAASEPCATFLHSPETKALDAYLVKKASRQSPAVWAPAFMQEVESIKGTVQKVCPTSNPEKFIVHFMTLNATPLFTQVVERTQAQGASFPTTGTVLSYLAQPQAFATDTSGNSNVGESEAETPPCSTLLHAPQAKAVDDMLMKQASTQSPYVWASLFMNDLDRLKPSLAEVCPTSDPVPLIETYIVPNASQLFSKVRQRIHARGETFRALPTTGTALSYATGE